jgi:gas vesicle protein
VAHHTLERIPDVLAGSVEKVRDRAAEAVGSDGGSVLKELSKLGRHLGDVEDRLGDRLDDLAASLQASEERLDDIDAESRGTTWPRRLFWLLVGAGAGAAAAYFADPDRGEQRRHEVTEQATARAREVRDEVVERAKDVKDEAVAGAESVRTEAQLAAQDVAAEAQVAAQDVAAEAQLAAEDVRDQVQTSAERVADEAPTDRT